MDIDETLLIQSGKPIGIAKTQPHAPRVLIANSNLVPEWATWNTFNDLDKKADDVWPNDGWFMDLHWYARILQGTYETFAAAAKKHFNSDLTGKIVVTAGLGGMGGAQPLAIKMNNGIAICIEVDPSRMKRRIETKYLDISVFSLKEAISIALESKKIKKPLQ